MGDTSSRKDLTNSNNNPSKSRRSRSELIRMALGVYLKQKNYVATDKFRKSDLFLSQTQKQFIFNKMIEEDVSHSNAFLYSNVLCLNNNHLVVEQQFTKFVEFVQKQSEPIRTELSNLFGPLICHLYIELLKGREWKPAWTFLRNHAHHVAPIDNLNAPLPNKVNGCSINSNSHDESTSGSGSGGTAAFPAATTQIQFSPESTGNSHRDHFRDLIQSLSTCLRIEACDATDSIGVFRSSKYELEISLDAINILKQYLNRHGHVFLLNILQTWIYLDIKDIKAEDGKSVFNLQQVEVVDEKVDMANGPNIKPHVAIKREADTAKDGDVKTPKRTNHHMRQLRHSVHRCKKIENSIRTVNISDQANSLVCGTMDSNECHAVTGFNDTTIKIWQMNNHTTLGRNLYRKFNEDLCDWSVSKTVEEFDSSDDEEEARRSTLRSIPNTYKAIRKKDFDESKCADNSFDDYGGVVLRGHSRGVTDVLFSSHHPLLFSVSKDQTMRAWKAESYSCGAIYRGHNYPIWCVSESPIPSYLATGSRDYTARLWSIDREFPLITYVGHTQDVDCIAFHPNGNYLATGSCDLSVRLWSTTDGKLLRVFADCRYPVTSIAFSPNGKWLAAAGEETKIRIFDLAAGSQVAELRDHSAFVSSVAWNSANSKFASCCIDGSIRVWDVSKMLAGDSQAQSSSSQSTSTRLIWHMSGCKRTVKILFNSSDSVTCIGGS